MNCTYTEAVISKNSAAPASEGKRMPNTPKYMARRCASDRTAAGPARPWHATSIRRSTPTRVSDTTRGIYSAYDPFLVMGTNLRVQLTKSLKDFTSINNLLDRSYLVYCQHAGRMVNVGLRIRM